MSQPEPDLEQKNAIGGLDRLMVNFGVAIMAIIPTYIALTVRPKYVAPLITGDAEPDGRRGKI